MRFALLLTLALLLTAPASAQVSDASLSLIERTERGAWAASGEAVDRLTRAWMVEPPLEDHLPRIRRLSVYAAVSAARARTLFNMLRALRTERGDEVPQCPDEQTMHRDMNLVILRADDIADLHAMLFDPDASERSIPLEALQQQVTDQLESMRALIARQGNQAQSVCAPEASPEPPPPPPSR